LIFVSVFVLVGACFASEIYAVVPAVAAAEPVTVYVAIGGSDTGNCQSSATPCATIGYAAAQGYTVVVGPGTFKTNLSYFENGSNVIEGAGAETAPATIIEPLDTRQPVFDADRAAFTLQDVTIDGLGDADALTSDYGSDITVIDSTVTDAATAACACGPTGTITLTDSTISGNTVGITQNDPSADVDVADSTIAGNGTGLVGYSRIALAGSVVADNTTADCSLSALSGFAGGYEYDLDDDGTCGFSAVNHSQSDVLAGLGPLQSNGGPTDTMAPSLGSPLLNQIPVGTRLLCSRTSSDQRGVPRPQGTRCDIGAVELAVASVRSITSTDSVTSTANSRFRSRS
jgi:hypothetical protein